MTFKQHDCDSLPNSGVYIYIEDDDLEWTLNIQKEATESDLEENGHLENIGDTFWVTRIGILYCPFCGEKLPKLESVDPDENTDLLYFGAHSAPYHDTDFP